LEFFLKNLINFKKQTYLWLTFCFNKKYIILFIFFIFLFSLFIFSTKATYAGPWIAPSSEMEADLDTKVAAGLANEKGVVINNACSTTNLGRCLLLMLFNFAGFLLSLSAVVFTWAVDTNNIKYIISDNTALYEIWTYVRDILNMAFIMVLLFSAFCTIFQVEQYNYKKMLWKIVLMALLVNFSFPITRFIIDASNILMYTVINNSLFAGCEASKALGCITDKSGLGALTGPSSSILTSLNDSSLIATTIVIFMLAITFLAIGLLLLIRLIVLAILIIFSPISFVGPIIPGLSSYSSSWWDNLVKYSFFGPAIILGVAITVKLMQSQNIYNSLKETAKQAGTTALGSDATFFGYMAFVSIPIVLLWVVMGIAQKMSIAGAGAVMGAAQGAMKWSGKNLTGYRVAKFAAGAGVGYVGRKLAKGKYTKFVVPRIYKEAWKQRAAIKDREAYEESTGEMHDLFNKVISGGTEKTDYAFAGHEGKVAKYAKEISDVSTNSDYVIQQLESAIANKQLAKVEGALKVLAKENNLNDMMREIGKSYGDGVQTASPIHIKNALTAMLSKAGAGKNENTNEFLTKSLMTIGDVGINAGNMGLAGMGKYDKGIHQFRVTKTSEQAEVAAAKFQNLEAQQRQRVLHHNSVLGEGADGNVAEIDEVQEAILMKFDEGDLDQMNRARADLKRQFKKIGEGGGINEKTRNTFEKIKASNNNVKEYVETILSGKARPGGEKNSAKTNKRPAGFRGSSRS